MQNTKVTEKGRRAAAVLELLMQRAGLGSARDLASMVPHSHTTISVRLRGEHWSFRDEEVFAELFGVPVALFSMVVEDAGRWLIDNGRFVLDLRETAATRDGLQSGWMTESEPDGLYAASIGTRVGHRAQELCGV